MEHIPPQPTLSRSAQRGKKRRRKNDSAATEADEPPITKEIIEERWELVKSVLIHDGPIAAVSLVLPHAEQDEHSALTIVTGGNDGTVKITQLSLV